MNFQHIFSHHPQTSYFFKFLRPCHTVHRFLSLHQWHGDVNRDAGAQLCYIAKPPEPNWEKNYWTMYNECANNCLRYDLMGLSPTVTDNWTWIVYADCGLPIFVLYRLNRACFWYLLPALWQYTYCNSIYRAEGVCLLWDKVSLWRF